MSDLKATYTPNDKSGTQPVGAAEEFVEAVEEAVLAVDESREHEDADEDSAEEE